MRELRQNGEAFGACGASEGVVEGDQRQDVRIIAGGNESSRELKGIHATQMVLCEQMPRAIDDWPCLVNRYPSCLERRMSASASRWLSRSCDLARLQTALASSTEVLSRP